MDIKIYPGKLAGTVRIPSSKSFSHRNIIAAALAKGDSVVRDVSDSKDITVTCGAMTAFGAHISSESGIYNVEGIGSIPENAYCDCGESGSTLRFMIPIAAALGIETTFDGHGKLPERPITPYIREFSKKGISFDRNGGLPITMKGRLQSGVFEIEGDISSQFITGLLFALPLLDSESRIKLLSPLQSLPYALMTIDVLKRSGIDVQYTGDEFIIPGGQHYSPIDVSTEGDYSQAAFFFTANAINSDIYIRGLNENSVQGDKYIIDIINGLDGSGFECDVSDIPDLVPVLAVLGAAKGGARLYNAARLRIKESDRIESTAALISALGGKTETTQDSITIFPADKFNGGEADSCNDHRIVMAAAIASVYSDSPIIIHGAQAVEKSYPAFFDDFRSLGGRTEIL